MPDPQVNLIGDSLTYQAQAVGAFAGDGWRINGKEGRPLYTNMTMNLIRQHANLRPDVLILALGSNDVNKERDQMRQDISRAMQICRGKVSCLIITTVKVLGVTPFYGDKWVRYARNWNRACGDLNIEVADWNAFSADHSGWFGDDGLHMTRMGKFRYADFLKSQVGAIYTG